MNPGNVCQNYFYVDEERIEHCYSTVVIPTCPDDYPMLESDAALIVRLFVAASGQDLLELVEDPFTDGGQSSYIDPFAPRRSWSPPMRAAATVDAYPAMNYEIVAVDAVRFPDDESEADPSENCLNFEHVARGINNISAYCAYLSGFVSNLFRPSPVWESVREHARLSQGNFFVPNQLFETLVDSLAVYDPRKPVQIWHSSGGSMLVDLALSDRFDSHPAKWEALKTLLVLASQVAVRWDPGESRLTDYSRMGEVCEVRSNEILRLLQHSRRSTWEKTPRRNFPRDWSRPKILLTVAGLAFVDTVCALDMEARTALFHQKVEWEVYMRIPAFRIVHFRVDRESIFDDSIALLRDLDPNHLREGFAVHFRTEDGLDSGGLTREWFAELSKEIFTNPDRRLFLDDIDHTRNLFRINPAIERTGEVWQMYSGVGCLIALALVAGVPLGVKLPYSFWVSLLRRVPSMNELRFDDPAVFEGLEKLLSTNLDFPPGKGLADDLTMVAPALVGGKVVAVQLVENGDDIPVNQRHKRFYAQKLIQFKLVDSVAFQTNALIDGFSKILPLSIIVNLFDPHEFNLLLEGESFVDVKQLRDNSITGGGFTADSPQVVWFWEIASNLSQQDLRKLLQFATGDPSVPLGGFSQLKEPFIVSTDLRPGADLRYPSARTCFNRINLPIYSSPEILKDMLARAISSNSGFGYA